MKRVYRIFTVLFFVMVMPNALALEITKASNKCSDTEYKNKHPYECVSFLGTVAAPFLSSATVLGGAFALISLANAADTTNQSQTYYQPTLPTYNLVGGDVEQIHLAEAINTPEYERNFNQYNDIRLGYSIARGYTGKGATIVVLDAGLDSVHGETVAKIASGPIAPDAKVNSYKIAYNMEFVSYGEIGNVIASAENADVFNSSWSVPMRATELKSRQHLINVTDINFVNHLSAAAERGAIFVWAAGNDYSTQSSALSAIPSVMPEMEGHFINVVAWDSETGALADYSNACGITGQWCITAPGTNISTDNFISSGTSFAAPIVSAAVAVIKEAFPYMAAEQITSLLFETARDLGAPGIDAIYGHGMLDLERATRPVGAPLVPIGDNEAMQPLQPARVSGALAHNILSTKPDFAYFDKYGRAFKTNLSDVISVQNPGIGFQRLRKKEDIKIAKVGMLELGMSNSDLVIGDGFLQTKEKEWFNFIGVQKELRFKNIKLFQKAKISFGTPKTVENSMISNFSNVYAASVDFGATIGDWSFGVSIPDTVIDGTMGLRLPIGRADNGAILYNDYEINMRSRPAIEYSISYKSITASFVDNPYGTDEFFILTRGKISF